MYIHTVNGMTGTFKSNFYYFQVMEKYSVPDYRNTNEFLTHLGKRLGKLKKGKLPAL